MSGVVCAIRTGDEATVSAMLDRLEIGDNGHCERVVEKHPFAIFGGRADKKSALEGAFEAPDKKTCILFSGSLYNGKKLREQLKPKPKGTSDAALVLALYKQRGRKCVHYLDGSFAFVIVDGDTLLAARDPLGQRPLYYARRDTGWLFASDLKAFLSSDAKVVEFPAGCYLDLQVGARRYFKLPERPASEVNVQEATEIVRMLVTDAVRKRCREGELGVYLTGSVESCIVAAIAAEKNRKIRTFSVGLEGTQDGHTAKKVASWIGTDHTHVEVTEQDILDKLPEIVHTIETFDAPLVRHGVADFFAAKAAREVVDVLVGSDGANELFAGYPYLRPMFPEKLSDEVRKITEDLHHTQLQRWDRITRAFSLEGRLPYLDRRLVHTAFRLPVNLKISDDGRSKWILRRAFSTELPAWVVDRPDHDDVHFTGIQEALKGYAETVFSDEDLVAAQRGESDLPPRRTKDELLYFHIWSSKFPASFVKLLGRTELT
ncbi:MAG: hypothetical protein D8M53_09750 [Armatimonadetes bacterium]|nr:hypothetical protein [Armatimonadota bacterium]